MVIVNCGEVISNRDELQDTTTKGAQDSVT